MFYKIAIKIESVYYFFRYDIPCGVHNLISWFPLIWKHRDFDSNFTLLLMKKGLTDLHAIMKEEVAVWDGTEGSEFWGASEEELKIIAAEKNEKTWSIVQAIKLLERLIDEDIYHKEAFEEFDAKWGEWDINKTIVEANDDGWHGFDYISGFENVVNEEDYKKCEEENRICTKKEEESHNKDVEDFGNVMKNFRYWWS